MGTDNKDFANRPDIFANQPPLQTTLRELQAIIANPRFWIGFGAVMILLAITGPFGTIELMDTSKRLVYWATICLTTFFVGSAVSMFVSISLAKINVPVWLAWLAGGLAPGLPVGAIAWGLNIYVFDINIAASYTFPRFIFYTTIISVVVVVLSYLIIGRSANQPAITPSPFLRRLPKHLGKDILSLEAQDHYVNVTTNLGSTLVLIRLADAIDELAGIDGLRIHRSYWIAKTAIAKTLRKDGKPMIELTNGTTLPVSRTYAKSLKDLMS